MIRKQVFKKNGYIIFKHSFSIVMIKVAIFTKVMVQHFAKRWAFVIIKILKLTLNVDWETVPLTKIITYCSTLFLLVISKLYNGY